jgi:thiosulfate/3-mercaptopyruvate sulfurtransferase
MKRIGFTASVLISSLILGNAAYANPAGRWPGPLVSCDWLESHTGANDLVIVDIRTAAEYAAGHIEHSVSAPFEVPYSAWITMRDDLLLELPDTAALFSTLRSLGISPHSKVVVVTSAAQPPYPQANAPRVAETLGYAGVRDVTILDGGYPAWVAQGRPTTTAVPTVTPSTFAGTVDGDAFVDLEHVAGRIGTALLLDARDPEVYAGNVIEPWADKPGHIPTAVSLPATLIWNADGTYKSRRELRNLAEGVIGRHGGNREIIVYCGVGGYAGSWRYVLSAILGYTNVTMYDGSAQEWVRYHDMEM